MSICKRCGKKVSEAEVFCSRCGLRMNTCPVCGANARDTDAQCIVCNSTLATKKIKNKGFKNNTISFTSTDQEQTNAQSISFPKAISNCFKNYFSFRGAASRSEFWFFTLFCLLITLPFYEYFRFAIYTSYHTIKYTRLALAFALFAINTILLLFPFISVAIRRLHDTGHSGWYILIPIYNFILFCTSSTKNSVYQQKEYYSKAQAFIGKFLIIFIVMLITAYVVFRLTSMVYFINNDINISLAIRS